MSRTPPDGRFAPRPVLGRARGGRPAAPVAVLVCSLAVALAGCAPAVPIAPSSPVAAVSPGPRTPTATSFSTPSASPSSSVGPTPAAPTIASAGPDLLLLLTTESGVATLSLVRLSGDVVPVALPDPSVAAVVPIAEGRLMAVLRDGSAFVAARGPAGLAAGSVWHALALSRPAAMPEGQLIWSAGSSPNGTRVAAIAGPPDRMAPTSLVVIEPATGRREIRALEEESQGSPPAWVDGSHVVIVKRDRYDSVFLALLDAATGLVTDRLRIRALDFEVSGDTSTAAALMDGDRVVIGSTASVLTTRRLPETGPALPAGDRVSGGIALSRDGRFVAIVIQGETGPHRLAIYEEAAGEWHAGASIALPGSVFNAIPSWLP